MSRCCSYVTLPSGQVESLCKAMMASIQDERAALLDKEVAFIIARSQLSWARRLLKRPVTTKQEALAGLEADSYMFSPWMNAKMLYWDQYMLCERLLVAAKTTSEVHLSVEDLESIS